MRYDDERGDIISNWLVQLVAIMAVVAFVGFEGVSIIMAHLSLDEDGREVALAARGAYGDTRDPDEAIEAGRSAAEERGAEVVSVLEIEDPPALVFELERTASTLVIHRLEWLEGMTVARTDRRVRLDR